MLFFRKPKPVDTQYTAKSAEFRRAFNDACKNGTPLPPPLFPPLRLVNSIGGISNQHEVDMHVKNSAMWREEFDRRVAIDKAAKALQEPARARKPASAITQPKGLTAPAKLTAPKLSFQPRK